MQVKIVIATQVPFEAILRSDQQLRWDDLLELNNRAFASVALMSQAIGRLWAIPQIEELVVAIDRALPEFYSEADPLRFYVSAVHEMRSQMLTITVEVVYNSNWRRTAVPPLTPPVPVANPTSPTTNAAKPAARRFTLRQHTIR